MWFGQSFIAASIMTLVVVIDRRFYRISMELKGVLPFFTGQDKNTHIWSKGNCCYSLDGNNGICWNLHHDDSNGINGPDIIIR